MNREADFMVLEEDPNTFNMDDMDMGEVVEEKSPWYKDKRFIIGVVAAAALIAAVIVFFKIKKKEEADSENKINNIE